MKKIVLLGFLSVLLSTTLSLCVVSLLKLQITRASPYTSIEVDTAYNMITNGSYPDLVVLDVRRQDEYDSGHIYGAVWIPHTELEARIGELVDHENHEIIVYCRAGVRSVTASGILDSHNFTKVYNMLGGIQAWQSAGYPVWIATVHNVNTTFNYDTIQAAIDATQTLDGHTISVDAGIYYEHVTIDKSILLIGENKYNTIIDGNVTGTVVYVTVDSINISNFTIRNSGPYPDMGIYVDHSSDNNITRNIVTNNYDAIVLDSSSNNIISGNSITNNGKGIFLVQAYNNSIYHNNFTNNTQHAYDESWDYPSIPPSTNVWNNGYPSGGNYWSNYTGVDVKSGPNQNESGSDGIGDTSYEIDENNQDNYPLMNPWGAPSPPSYTLTIYSSPTGVTFTVDGVSRTTHWSGTYSEGTSVSLIMSEIHTVGEAKYYWNQWSDGVTSWSRTVTMNTNITLTAVFIPDTTPPTPPTISIVSPENKTYPVNDVPLTFTVSEPTSWMGYSLDSQCRHACMNVTISGNTTIVDLSDGTHTLTVYANDTAGNMGYSDIVYFTVDTVSPNIEILSPENKTYTTSSVSLSFTVDEATSWIGYSLDGQANVTITGNTTLSGLSDGSHSLRIYAKNAAGNTGASETIYFTIEAKPEPPQLWIVAVVAAVVIGTVMAAIFLWRKRK